MSQPEQIPRSVVQPKSNKVGSEEIKRRKKERRKVRLKEAKASIPETWNAGSPLMYEDLISVSDADIVSLWKCYQTVQVVKLTVAMYNEKRQKNFTTKPKKGCTFARSDGHVFAVRCGLCDDCKYFQRFNRQEIINNADVVTFGLVFYTNEPHTCSTIVTKQVKVSTTVYTNEMLVPLLVENIDDKTNMKRKQQRLT